MYAGLRIPAARGLSELSQVLCDTKMYSLLHFTSCNAGREEPPRNVDGDDWLSPSVSEPRKPQGKTSGMTGKNLEGPCCTARPVLLASEADRAKIKQLIYSSVDSHSSVSTCCLPLSTGGRQIQNWHPASVTASIHQQLQWLLPNALTGGYKKQFKSQHDKAPGDGSKTPYKSAHFYSMKLPFDTLSPIVSYRRALRKPSRFALA